jgi:uncharacterized protein YqjF (DUF2071 family)
VDAPREPISVSPARAITRPLLTMRWERLTYLHWIVDPEVVQARLPAGLTVDTHDGVAHVGLVPFVMGGIRLGLGRRGGPTLPLPYGRFPETNVRTYVVGPDGGRGVYFHSLDVTRLAPTLVAQGGYRLPTPDGAILRAHVDHPPWPFRSAQVRHLADGLVAAAGFGPLADRPPDHVRFGGAVPVRVGPPRRVG